MTIVELDRLSEGGLQPTTVAQGLLDDLVAMVREQKVEIERAETEVSASLDQLAYSQADEARALAVSKQFDWLDWLLSRDARKARSKAKSRTKYRRDKEVEAEARDANLKLLVSTARQAVDSRIVSNDELIQQLVRWRNRASKIVAACRDVCFVWNEAPKTQDDTTVRGKAQIFRLGELEWQTGQLASEIAAQEDVLKAHGQQILYQRARNICGLKVPPRNANRADVANMLFGLVAKLERLLTNDAIPARILFVKQAAELDCLRRGILNAAALLTGAAGSPPETGEPTVSKQTTD